VRKRQTGVRKKKKAAMVDEGRAKKRCRLHLCLEGAARGGGIKAEKKRGKSTRFCSIQKRERTDRERREKTFSSGRGGLRWEHLTPDAPDRNATRFRRMADA